MTAWIVVSSDVTANRLLSLAFCFAGLALLSTPWFAILRTRRTLYMLTDQRALILRAGEQLAQSFTPVSLQQVKCRKFRGGYGDLVFRIGEVSSQHGQEPSWQRQGFLSIPDVWRVEFLVRRLAKTWREHEQPDAG